MEYKREQTTAILRRKNAIRAYRILDMQGNNLIVRNNLDKGKMIEFAVSGSGNFKVGSYVDMIFTRMGSSNNRIDRAYAARVYAG